MLQQHRRRRLRARPSQRRQAAQRSGLPLRYLLTTQQASQHAGRSWHEIPPASHMCFARANEVESQASFARLHTEQRDTQI